VAALAAGAAVAALVPVARFLDLAAVGAGAAAAYVAALLALGLESEEREIIRSALSGRARLLSATREVLHMNEGLERRRVGDEKPSASA
jgi:hypothetical protein